MCVGDRGDKKKVSDLLEPELQGVVSHHMWVLGTEPQFPIREVSALNDCAIPPTPLFNP